MERIILALFRVISSAHIKTKRGTEFRGVAAVPVSYTHLTLQTKA